MKEEKWRWKDAEDLVRKWLDWGLQFDGLENEDLQFLCAYDLCNVDWSCFKKERSLISADSQ